MVRAALCLPLFALLIPWAAHATGVCEGTGTRYQAPTLFAESSELFAVPATASWCEERQNEGSIEEVRGTVTYTELRDVRGRVVTSLSEATGKDRIELAKIVGSAEWLAPGMTATWLKDKGFAPIQATGPVARENCAVHATWKAAPKEQINGFPAARLGVELRAGKKVVHRLQLGLAAETRKGSERVVAHFFKTKRMVALFTLLPTCEGPPPGYFGPDDPGSCYDVDVLGMWVVDAGKGDLARCFARK